MLAPELDKDSLKIMEEKLASGTKNELVYINSMCDKLIQFHEILENYIKLQSEGAFTS